MVTFGTMRSGGFVLPPLYLKKGSQDDDLYFETMLSVWVL